MSEIPELTHELRARMRYHASRALAYRAQEKPEAKVAINDYLEAIAPATLIALLDENERQRALLSDLLRQSSKSE
ncbi:hypothetical protein [Serratia fonticola]